MDVSISALYRQNKAFQERVYYWMRKGLPREEAEERAKAPRRRLAIVRPDHSYQYQHQANPESRRPGFDLAQSSAPGFPSLPIQEIQAPVQVQNNHNQISGFQQIQTRARDQAFHGMRLATNQGTRPLVAESAQVVFCGLVVLSATGLLIQSSAEVLGSSVQAWTKAVLLEVGILGLSLYRAKGLSDLIVSKLGACFLVGLSLLVLHTGVRTSETKALTAVESSSEELRSLREERVRLLETYDALPPDHVTRRGQLMADIRALSSRIDSERQTASQGHGAKVIEATHLVEALVRVALLFLNLCFAHGLVSWWRATQSARVASPVFDEVALESCGLEMPARRRKKAATASI